MRLRIKHLIDSQLGHNGAATRLYIRQVWSSPKCLNSTVDILYICWQLDRCQVPPWYHEAWRPKAGGIILVVGHFVAVLWCLAIDFHSVFCAAFNEWNRWIVGGKTADLSLNFGATCLLYFTAGINVRRCTRHSASHGCEALVKRTDEAVNV